MEMMKLKSTNSTIKFASTEPGLNRRNGASSLPADSPDPWQTARKTSVYSVVRAKCPSKTSQLNVKSSAPKKKLSQIQLMNSALIPKTPNTLPKSCVESSGPKSHRSPVEISAKQISVISAAQLPLL